SVSSKEDKAKARAIVDSISDIKKSLTKVFTVAHIPSAYSDYLYVMNGRTFSEPERDIIEKKMEEGHHYYYFQQMLDAKKAEMATAVGQQYTDLAMPNPKGKTIRVSDYVKKNKYTLIDFWASWCGPCRAEMPTVVKAYNLYHKKGFEVVGVSFDNNKAAWVKAIAQLKLSWPHMSDLKGWECAASSVYNVKGIPANVLVDSQGTIVAKNLRGENLLNELAKLMK
ncbi:MAG: TlpA family protein disulfide reductase, partial [Prevotella sp.]|nr:TlpA family protein disulfide reductase [Prevotella sp.]